MDSKDFIVVISLVSTNNEKKTKTYKIKATQHFRVNEVTIELPHPNSRFYIDARGGHGGKG